MEVFGYDSPKNSLNPKKLLFRLRIVAKYHQIDQFHATETTFFFKLVLSSENAKYPHSDVQNTPSVLDISNDLILINEWCRKTSFGHHDREFVARCNIQDYWNRNPRMVMLQIVFCEPIYKRKTSNFKIEYWGIKVCLTTVRHFIST